MSMLQCQLGKMRLQVFLFFISLQWFFTYLLYLLVHGCQEVILPTSDFIHSHTRLNVLCDVFSPRVCILTNAFLKEFYKWL